MMNWDSWILENEITIRLVFFFGIFAVIAIWELILPRRSLRVSKGLRWLSNIGLVFLNSLVIRLLFPTAAIGVAVVAQTQGWGLIGYYQVPFLLAFIMAVVVMDLVIYLQHVLVHAIPVLWRLHRVHHADLDFDVTTGARFHPLEIVLSMLIKFATIVLLGPPVVAVVVFEVMLNVSSMFNHGNIYIPEKIDRILRLFVVTPDMHRVHHSVHAPLTNSNFGFSLPWWDRLFGTYVAQPRENHQDMEIGLDIFRDPKQVNRLPGMLKLPFVSTLGEYSINRRR